MLIQFAIKNLVTKKRNSLVSLVGVVISVALAISVILVLRSAQASFVRSLEGSGADIIVQLQGEPCVWSLVKLPQNLNPISIKKMDEIEALDEVGAIEGSLITWAFSTPPPIRSQEIESSTETEKLQGIMVAISKGELEGQPCNYAPEGSFCDLETKPGNLDISTADFRPIVVTGINPELKNIGPINETDLNSLEGRFFTKEDNYVTILDKDFARTRNMKVGGNVDLGQRNFIVIGIIDSGREAKIAGAQAFIPLKTAIEITGRGNIVDIIFIKLKGGVELNAVRKKIQKILGDGNATITTSNDYLSTISSFASLTQGFSLAIFFIVLLISLVIIIKTTLASVFERSREIGILKGIGWLNKDITRVIIIENFIIGLLGSIIGSICGYIASFIYKANLSSVLPNYLNPYPPCSQYLAKSTIQISMQFPVNIFLLVIFLTVTIKSLSGYLASKKILKLSPAEAIRKI